VANLVGMAIVDGVHNLDKGVSGFSFSVMALGDNSVEKFTALAKSKWQKN